jgi:hypothetical protein
MGSCLIKVFVFFCALSGLNYAMWGSFSGEWQYDRLEKGIGYYYSSLPDSVKNRISLLLNGEDRFQSVDSFRMEICYSRITDSNQFGLVVFKDSALLIGFAGQGGAQYVSVCRYNLKDRTIREVAHQTIAPQDFTEWVSLSVRLGRGGITMMKDGRVLAHLTVTLPEANDWRIGLYAKNMDFFCRTLDVFSSSGVVKNFRFSPETKVFNLFNPWQSLNSGNNTRVFGF